MPESIIKRILLVEDEVLIAMTETMQLEKYGYTVHHGTTGEKAVQTITDNSHPVDLILMDINLGSGIDGTQAAEKILNHKDIPVVFLSSHTEPEIVEKTEKITSYGYVVKSSSIVVLDASIKMALKLFEAKMAHKQKEEDLRKSDYKYRMLFENMNVSFALHEAIYDDNSNPVDYRYLDMNPMFLNNLGCEASAIYGHTARELFPNTEQYWIDTFGEVAKTGKSVSFQNYSCELNQWFNTVVFSPQKNQFASFFIDITEQKKVEESLKASELRKHSYFKQAPYGIFISNSKGEYLEVNPEACELTGFSEKELINMRLTDLLLEEDHQAGLNHFKKLKESGNAYGETRFLKKDGTTRWWSVAAAKTSDNLFLGFCEDITERKQAEEALRESEEKYSSLFNQAVGAIYLHDFQGNMIDVNEAACEQTGYSKSELLQLTVFDIHVTGKETINLSKAETKRIWKQSKVGERRSVEGEHKSKDGNFFPVRLSTGAIRYGNNVVIMAVVEDITEKKQAEEEIQKQLSEKETLLREVYHRVKNNIATIESLLSLQIGDADSSEVKASLQDAISRVQSIRVLYDKLLISEDVDEISIKNYAESLLDSIVMFFDPENRIIIEKHITDFEVDARKAVSIGIIINELLTNVFKYAFGDRDTGTVSVSIEKIENMATLIIQDNGIGIDEKIMENKSPGFGLTIVKMLVEQLEGTYSIVNEHGTRSLIMVEI